MSEIATEKLFFFCETNSLWSGFKGLLCEENINDCVPEPCHHGECKDGIATFSCECYAGYTGSICNIQVQECHSNPCQNRGRCIDLVNAYQCNCPPGITGRFSVKLFSCWTCFLAIISSVRPWNQFSLFKMGDDTRPYFSWLSFSMTCDLSNNPLNIWRAICHLYVCVNGLVYSELKKIVLLDDNSF